MSRPARAIRCVACRLAAAATLFASLLTHAGELWRDFTVYSRSGQFVVHSPYASASTLAQPILVTNSTFVTLAPDSLAVSCERIKKAVLRDLDLADRWQGKIHVSIRPALAPNATPAVVSTRYADRWQYAVDLPEQIDPPLLVRSLVQVLLTEIANRAPGSHPPEIPLWLVEGLTGRALSGIGPDIVTTPTGTVAKFGPALAQIQSRSRKPLAFDQPQRMRAWLMDHPALSFAELSLPGPDLLSGDPWRTYQYSAQLFLTELMNLPGGRRCLAFTLNRLTATLNWQTAFVESFAAHFGRFLDIEKWWGVSAAHFVLGDQPHTWTPETALEKLESLLRIHVRQQDARDAEPRLGEVRLQDLLAKTPFDGHRAVVADRIERLGVIAVCAPPALAPLAQDYRAVLANYVALRPRAGFGPASKRQPAVNVETLVHQTIQRLDELDRRRAILSSASRSNTPLAR